MFGTGKKFNINNVHEETVHLRPMQTPTKTEISKINKNSIADGKHLTKINSSQHQSRKTNNSEMETINIGSNQKLKNEKPKKISAVPVPVITNKPLSSSSSSSMVVSANKAGDIDETCICTRKSKTIFCAACQKFSFGRIKLPCPVHFNVLFLFDFSHCHHCQAGWYMMKEIDIEYSKIMEIESAKEKAITDAKEAKTERQKKY